ncbi:MAG: methyltransferase domain-containing protein [Actinomycetota bacterium]|nr:methyltransferase domain-containing protein [Actinomycetota bacterium]
MLDEVASAGRENLEVEHVARYDGKEDAGAAAEVEFLAVHGLTADSVVVDIGPGTGQFVLAAAARCRRVIAVDVSPPMLARLAANTAVAGLDNVEIVQAGFLTYQHQGPPVDLVYSRYALHHLPDAWKAIALTRIHALLRPGGVFRLWDVVYSFTPQDAEAGFETWCATAPGKTITDPHAWSRAEYEEHIRDEHSTFTWLLEPMAERAGFIIETADHSADGMFAQYLLRASHN